MTSRQSDASNSVSMASGKAFAQYRPLIEKQWVECIRDTCVEDHRARKLPAGRGSGSDLLSIVCEAVASGGVLSDAQMELIRARIRTKVYSVSDLFKECVGLQTALEKCRHDVSPGQDPALEAQLIKLREALDSVSQSALRGTAEFLENVIEDCSTGFCQTDLRGRIVYLNDELQRIAGRKDLEGSLLEDLFEARERKTVKQAFVKSDRKIAINQILHLVNSSGELIPVGIELSVVCIRSEPVGGYAFITDLTRPIRLQNEIYDRFLLGIIQLDPDQRITYTNQSMRDMLGMEGMDWKGWKIDRIVPEEDLPILRSQLEKRWKGQSDEYEIHLRRQDDERNVPVRISASPHKDRHGNVIGTMGIVRSIVGEKMHHSIESLRNCNDLLKAVANLLRSALPFDRLYVAVFSKDKRHVRNLFTFSPNGFSDSNKRWWEMSPAMLVWSKRRKIIPIKDLETFYAKPEFRHLKNDPVIKEILQKFRSFIYYPIFKKNDLVACMAIYSANENPYTEVHCRLLKQLPMDAAVLSALSFEENDRFLFLLELLKEISSKGNNVKKTAEIIVARIARHFEWESVALLRVNRMNRKITLLSQSNLSNDFRIRDDYEQKIDEGILGEVYATQKAVLIDDVTREEFKHRYKETVPQTRSELCMPIVSGDLFWLLNIEDPRTNAFSEDEKEALKLVIDEIKVFMERTWLRSFMNKALISTSDAVLVVDDDGTVTLSNSAAQRMLGYEQAELEGKSLKDLLIDSNMSDDLIQKDSMPNVRVTMKTKADKEIRLLLSKFQLHEEISSNIIIAKDLSLEDRVQELEYIGKLYYEIAIQTKTPLTLAFSWLRRAEAQNKNSNIRELIEKTLRQLRKMDLTFNRLAMYDKSNTESPGFPYDEMLIEFEEVWSNLESTFPKTEMERVRLTTSGEPCYLRGDTFYITFCFETIFSYLLRYVPDDDVLQTDLVYGAENLHVRINGYFPPKPVEKDRASESRAISKTLMDMALGEGILRSFIAKCGGTYYPRRITDHRIEFTFELPIVKQA